MFITVSKSLGIDSSFLHTILLKLIWLLLEKSEISQSLLFDSFFPAMAS